MKFIQTLVRKLIQKRASQRVTKATVNETDELEETYSLLHTQMGSQILNGIF